MAIYIHYDPSGSIHSMISVNAPPGGGMMLVPKPGVLTAEIEGLNFKSKDPTPEELREIASSHKVSSPAPRVTLTRKA